MRRRIRLLAVDIMLVFSATLAALALRENLELSTESIVAIGPYLGFSMAAAALSFISFDLDRTIWRMSALPDYVRVLIAVIVAVCLSATACFMFNRLSGVARTLPIVQAILMIFFLVGARVAIRHRHTMRHQRRMKLMQHPLENNINREVVLVVGLNRISKLFLQSAREFAANRFEIVGLLGHKPRYTGRYVQQQQVLGTPEELPKVLRELEVRGIFVSRIVVTATSAELSREAAAMLREIKRSTPIKVDFFAENLQFESTDPPSATSRSHAALHTENLRFLFTDEDIARHGRRLYWRVKRLLDALAAAILIVVCLPVFLAVAILVAVDLGMPVLFWQQRPGLGRRPFKVYKFRTMAPPMTAAGKLRSESQRLSPIGGFLRRSRLDELPQLFQILAGDMSFVGPRPLLPIDQPPAYAARLLVRPGLTGWAQVIGGREISAEDKAALDIWYVENASLMLDVEIVLRTMHMIVAGERVDEQSVERAWDDLRRKGICSASA